MPRADCQYRRLDFAALPTRKRAGAAMLAARRLDPRQGALVHVAWTGSVAHLWTWAGGIEAVALGEAGWVPESLLRAAPRRDGLRLLRQVRGVEGQYWRDGRLQASRWWPEEPGPEAWQRFARACGIGAEDAVSVPDVEDAGWADAWGDARRGLPATPAVLERWAWTAGIAVLAFALAWQATAQVQWAVAKSRLDTRLDALRQRAAPLLAARERADAARDALLALRSLPRGHDDYALMAAVIEPLPADARMSAWVRDGDKLTATIASGDADPRHFVAAYGSNPTLSGVVATPAAAGMALAFDLAAAPPGASSSAPRAGDAEALP